MEAILWPNGATSRICGPMGEMTCNSVCELKVVNECLYFVIRRQRKGAVLPGVIIFTDCRALVQALGKSGSESMGGVVLLADYL
ncbi:hypothetical protein PoB_003470100 [Plakobranchus ocellatus]|uniref:Reverse transcriptase RNase H-like domain-containing protein n=1 Tax=Plakobranchus ocellatus TaxID=259542 RepID=A0AAV4AIP5_9GAST|nr:hypothetical protein PoB_003470100 [Plakobranchus ocellatus]